jgi:FAD/FMN-containing dehydrogenase
MQLEAGGLMTERVVAALERALGQDIVLHGEAVPPRNRQDWSGLPGHLPLALVRPRRTEEVATCLRLCHAAGVPVVPQGGLTGLCGGAIAGEREVALSLERMSGVEELDPATATMTVLAGTPLEVVQNAARDAGFFCPLDLGARGSCAIGGNISTNAGGNRVIRYGMTRDMVLGLEVVLADGTVVRSLNRMIKNNAGFDLKHLFIGSEGTLGVVTRAVLRLHPAPQLVATAFCGTASFAAVIGLLERARRELAGTLSAFEVMWPEFYELMTTRVAGVRRPLAGPHGLYLLIETQSAAIGGGALEGLLERALEAGLVEDAVIAQSEADTRSFWAIRDAVADFNALLGPRVEFDVGLPVGRMGEFVDACRASLARRWPDIVLVVYGHLGDGNLHLQVAVPGAEPQPKREVYDIVYGLVGERRGSISAEHGIGTLKLPYLAHSRTPEEIALMATLKRALDPRGILNPGKVIPS